MSNYIKSDAKFSECGKYRYKLIRQWKESDESKGYVNFVMLNPSTADANEDDPTVLKCVAFAKHWGYGGIIITNAFAFRTSKTAILFDNQSRGIDNVGPENYEYIKDAKEKSDKIVLGWGDTIAVDVKQLKEILGSDVYCLGEPTKKGNPRHPNPQMQHLPIETPLKKYNW